MSFELVIDNIKKLENERTRYKNKLDAIKKTIDYYQKNRDHWDWDNLIDDLLSELKTDE